MNGRKVDVLWLFEIMKLDDQHQTSIYDIDCQCFMLGWLSLLLQVCLLIFAMRDWHQLGRQEYCLLGIGIPVIIAWATLGWVAVSLT